MYKHWPSTKVDQPSQSFLFVVNCSPSFVRKYKKKLTHSRPQSLLGAWARGPGGSGDTGFEVLDFRTSGHFRFKSNLEGCLFKALNQPNLKSLTLRQEQVNAIRNVVENQKSAEVLKFQLSWNYNWVFSVIFCDTWNYKKRCKRILSKGRKEVVFGHFGQRRRCLVPSRSRSLFGGYLS